MMWIERSKDRMGSNIHDPEEAPAHRVRVEGFFIDPYPVTNRQFAAFIAATGYRTVAERPPDPTDYPGALPHMLKGRRAGFSQDARAVKFA
jgi:formylglycine-generating enzyme required for sulfatase activity